MAKEKSQPTHAGFHFVNLYQCCRRKFYLRYVCGLDSPFTHTALLFGSAFHEGKAHYYKTKDAEAALDVARDYLYDSESEFESGDEMRTSIIRCPRLLRKWIGTFGESDFAQYNILHLEETFNVALPNGFTATIKPDAVMENKISGDVYIFDTKTASFSARLTTDTVEYGDQATMYLYGMQQVLGKAPSGFVPDIAYWNKQTQDIAKAHCARPTVVMRSNYELKSFAEGFAQEMAEISSAVKTFDNDNERVWQLFRRNPTIARRTIGCASLPPFAGHASCRASR